jgi:hypothetical protein
MRHLLAVGKHSLQRPHEPPISSLYCVAPHHQLIRGHLTLPEDDAAAEDCHSFVTNGPNPPEKARLRPRRECPDSCYDATTIVGRLPDSAVTCASRE